MSTWSSNLTVKIFLEQHDTSLTACGRCVQHVKCHRASTIKFVKLNIILLQTRRTRDNMGQTPNHPRGTNMAYCTSCAGWHIFTHLERGESWITFSTTLPVHKELPQKSQPNPLQQTYTISFHQLSTPSHHLNHAINANHPDIKLAQPPTDPSSHSSQAAA